MAIIDIFLTLLVAGGITFFLAACATAGGIFIVSMVARVMGKHVTVTIDRREK